MSVDPEDRRAVAAFVRRSGLAVLATVDGRGGPQAALVGVAALEDGTLLFDSHADARKVFNLAHDDRIAVSVGLEGGPTIQIEGTAAVVTGEERVRCGQEYNSQVPGSRALDDEFVVVKVRVLWVRVYDATVTPASVRESWWN